MRTETTEVGDPPWSALRAKEKAAWKYDAEITLTVLLTVADVTWKENGDG